MSFHKKVGAGIEFKFTVGVGSLGKAITARGNNFFSIKASYWLGLR